jgi:DNA-binding transcriptional LysR family regulator
VREGVDAAFVDAALHRTSNFVVGQIADMAHYVSNGLGVAIVPRVFTRPGPAGAAPPEHIRVLRLGRPALGLTIGTYRRTGRPSPITGAFLDMVTHGVDARTHAPG